MALEEAERVRGSDAISTRLLPQTGVNVDGGEEGHGHWEVSESETMGEHGTSEEVCVLKSQCKPIAILTFHQIPHL